MSIKMKIIALTTSLFAGTCFAADAAKPSLDEMIGEMILVGFEGKTLQDSGVSKVLDYAKNKKIGSVIFYARNMDNADQIKSLTKALSSARSDLLISIDHEGGKIDRFATFKVPFPATPSAKETGTSGKKDEAYKIFKTIAENLKSYGFNVNLAPVVDIADYKMTNPGPIEKKERSYGEDSKSVIPFAEEFVKAHRETGIITSIKHFPGHGHTSADSHAGVVDITKTFRDDDLVPFQTLAKNGFADMVMTAHVFNSTWDDKYPVTLSPKVISQKLRKDASYDGVVITDDLHMGAIVKGYGFQDAVVSAINAGADILLFSNNNLELIAKLETPDKKIGDNDVKDKDFLPSDKIPDQVIPLIKKAITDGKIKQEQIEKSYARIQKLKKDRGILK